ncbi:MAG: hypothetical protein IT548_19660 [Alphaproteobacteria bacterium]|nr:hypothetical protein [Alphaproteobacteria bacterium]
MARVKARRTLWALAAATAAGFALSSVPPSVAEGIAVEATQADPNADPFPLDAKANPDELILGMNPAQIGTTVPVRVTGRTLPLGEHGVAYDITFQPEEGEARAVKSGEIAVGPLGEFTDEIFTPDDIGTYTIALTAPDGRGQAQLQVIAHEPPEYDKPDDAPSEAGKTAEEALQTLSDAIDQLPESPAKTDAKAKLAAAKAEVGKLAHDPELDRSISGVIGAIGSDKDLRDYAGPRLAQLGDGLAQLRAETKRVKEHMGGMSAAALGCHQLAMVSEGFKLVSALLNIKRSVIDVAAGLAKDVIADFASNAAKAKGAGPTLAFAVGQITKNAPELNRASAVAGNWPGLFADLGGFLTDSAFSQYCEQYTGPVTGRMEAHFFQPDEWWNYSFEVTARIVLYYPKNAAGSSIRVTGRIEGVAHSFKTEENALSVLFPKLMGSAVQTKRSFPPIEIGAAAANAAVLGTGASSGYIEGSAATLALPNSFLIEVSGLLEKNSMSVILGPAKSDFTAKHRVGVIVMSPLTMAPVFTWYELPFKDAHHLFERASQGQAMRIPITEQGKTMQGEARFDKPAPSSGEARGAYTVSIKLCNPGC